MCVHKIVQILILSYAANEEEKNYQKARAFRRTILAGKKTYREISMSLKFDYKSKVSIMLKINQIKTGVIRRAIFV